MKLRPQTLAGTYVRLEPVKPEHHDELRAALDCDPENWAIQLSSAQGEHWVGFWARMFADARIAYAAREVASGRVVGTSSFLFVDPHHATCEIGTTWFRPEVRGSAVNPEAKLLMLGAAFAAGAERVVLRVDQRNAQSQAAVLKLGAVREGVTRHDFVTWTGHRRSTVIFSILTAEWPGVRAGLEARLAQAGQNAQAPDGPLAP